MPSSQQEVVVLGGGAAGMTAALRLAESGARVTVLEREALVGGLCGTHERDGFRFDFGGHRFITKSPTVDAMVKELVGDELLLRTRSSVILNGGRRYRYPLELDDVLRRFGFLRGARAMASYAHSRARSLRGPVIDRSFEDWVVNRFGRDLYATFFGPYTEKLWGLAPDGISADWAAQRISLVSLTDVLVRLLGLRRGGARTYARRYLYPRLGIGRIFERMAEALAHAGGSLRLGTTVTGLELTHGRRVAAVRYRGPSGEHELRADAVVSTIALPTLARMTAGARPTAALRAACDALRFRGIRLLNIMLEGPEVSPHTWMYVSEPRYLAARIQEPRHRSPEMAPPGCTSLMLEIPCSVGDSIWTAPDATLYARCMDDLRALGLHGLESRTIASFSSFVHEGYPIYHLDYGHDRGRLLDHVGTIGNLVTCGRQGSFNYIFMDTAMEMGARAAAMVFDGGGDPRALLAMAEGGGLTEAKALTA